MSQGWENFKPAPIETFHGEALKDWHDGYSVPHVLARFKLKIMQEYGITSDAIPINRPPMSWFCGKCEVENRDRFECSKCGKLVGERS